MLHLQGFTRSKINVRRCVLCVLGSHTFVPFFRCARSKPQILTAVQSLKLFRWTQVYEWTVYQIYKFGTCVLEALSSKPAEGNFERHTLERVIPSRSHTDNGVFESIDHVPPENPNNSQSAQLHIFEDNAAVIHMINKGQSKLKARHKNAQSRFGLVVWECEFWYFIWIKYVRTDDQLADILTKGMFTTMQWHSLLTLCHITRTYESNDVRSSPRKLFTAQLQQSPKQVSGDDTNRVCWPGAEAICIKSIEIRLHSG